MEVVKIERKFKYNSVALPDPNPSLGPDQVREFYATQFPELNNAVVEGPVTKNLVSTWTFARAAGAKGAVRPRAVSAAEMVKATNEGTETAQTGTLTLAAQAGKCSHNAARLAEVALGSRSGEMPLSLPVTAYGFWG